ncbi:MAG: helix-turn-helix transcriptional regulator [Nitrososphaerota archaeon]|nr:helix-turn-helix transcriptional regulator [Nitrososphaerota archaeon]
MDPDALGEVLSSRARLTIESAVSVRPRTLGELSHLTGISVQGVLRHLKILRKIGIVEEVALKPRTPKARRAYVAKAFTVGDYSSGELVVVKSTDRVPSPPGQRGAESLEDLSGDLIVQRRRVREQARRLGRMIDVLVSDQQALLDGIDRKKLKSQEKLILTVLLTEETAEDGMRAMARYYGLTDRRALESALTKARRDG